MKILVTGGAGYVGSIFIPILLRDGHNVRVLDNLMFNQTVLLEHSRLPQFEFVKGDITKKYDVKKSLEGIDMIVHLAALVGYPLCGKYPELAKKINIDGTKNMNKARGNIPMVFTSTGSVYGDLEETCTEKSCVKPLSLYAETKLLAEREVMSGGEYIIFRPATAFGVSPMMRLDLIINDFTYIAYTKKKLAVYEPNARRTFIHVYDFSRALLHAIHNFDKMKNQVYNLGVNDLNITKLDIVNTLHRYVKFSSSLSIGEDIDKRDYRVSYNKIESTGFSGSFNLDDGIKELIKTFSMIGSGIESMKRTSLPNVIVED